jgi:exonuclease I
MGHPPDAEWQVNILPFGSIYWADEMPSIAEMLDKPEDVLVINLMFGLRMKLWDGEVLDAQEQQRWDAVRAQVPNWALFKRLTLSEQQKLARQEAEDQVEQEFQLLADDAEPST